MSSGLEASWGALPARWIGKQDLVEEVEDGGVEILFVGLLLLFKIVALRVALRNAAIGLLRGEELAGGLLHTAHGRLVAGEDAEVVLLAEALEELLDLLRRDLRIGADDEQHAAPAHAVGHLFQLGQRQDIFVARLASRLEHLAQAVPDQVVHLVLAARRGQGSAGAW